ncbi:FixH family protein [Bacillus sp. AFS017336]|uniref:FixH family protein n=1 Tax=Bacillus sp. AFS017336 TaxID=2033489 RepID=UPI000BF1F9DE|nr:FixH family protein [Bacillus sp. AFS017336]PEL13077.1 hypothetical protein CN601_06205 [Bacillus sp. AFS017336]
MKRIYYIFILLICSVLIFSSCGKNTELKSNSFLDKIQLTMNEKKSNNNNQTHVYQVNLVNSEGKEIDVDSVHFKMEMKSMNHHVEARMKKITNGVYEVSIELPMEGTWSKEVTLIKGKNQREITIK